MDIHGHQEVCQGEMECDFLHIWNNYADHPSQQHGSQRSNNSLYFRKHLKRLPNVTIYQLFNNKRGWIDNKRVWIQRKDDPPVEHHLIYAN